MRRVKVYVEGAAIGRGSKTSAPVDFRRAFSKLAGKLGVANQPSFIACGPRSETFKAAWKAFEERSPEDRIILLVDSESPPSYSPESAWKHLRERAEDKWLTLEHRHARYIFMMAVCMETWIIADSSSIASEFPSCFAADKIPCWPDLEQVEKQAVFDAIEKSTASCKDGWKKSRSGNATFQMFARLDPAIVRGKCPHANRFFDRLIEECKL